MIYMSFLTQNISIKIKDVSFMKWGISNVDIAARPYHALVLRLSGSASFTYDGFEISTRSGDVFYMPAGCSYNAVYREENEVLVIHFESDINCEMKNYRLNNTKIITVLFKRLLDIWNKKTEGYYYQALGVMCEVLDNISTKGLSVIKNETEELFKKAIDYMEENYLSCDMSVEKLVLIACMSNTYFRKLFVKRFGLTPAKYIVSKRLMYAEKLLACGKYSVKEVAEKSGFCDVKYFSRVMKKEYGVSPSKLYCYIKN